MYLCIFKSVLKGFRADEIVYNWESQGILDAAKKIANAGVTKAEIRENLRNFVWNDTLAGY